MSTGSSTPLLEIENLTISRGAAGEQQNIVTDIALRIAAGEAVGIVGESGSGKSVTARAAIGLLASSLTATGSIRYQGAELLRAGKDPWKKLRGTEIGMVLQDPFTMLNPLLRAESIVTESVRRAGGKRPSRSARREEAVARLAEVGIHDPAVVEKFPFQLSGGMRQRLAIAAALATDPNLLIADEPSTALDVTTQREAMSLIKRLQRSRGMGLMLITHDLRVAFNMCDRVYVMYAGSIVEEASTDQYEERPMHPYTLGLLNSEPPVEQRLPTLVTIPGTVPAPGEATDRCAFADRCRWATDACAHGRPPLRVIDGGRQSACVRISEIAGDLTPVENLATASDLPQHSDARPKPVLDLSGVRKTFPGRRGTEKVAVDGVDLRIGPGECVGLVGESGSGKTTLARMLSGLEEASEGTVEIDGIDVTQWSRLSSADARRVRRRVQVVFQDPYSTLNPMMRIGTVLAEAVVAHAPGAKKVTSQVHDLLDAVGLPASVAQQRPAALSGGMRQRVAIARALAADPSFLICDEPVSALDVSVQAQILTLIRRLHDERNLGYLFITHDLAVVRQITDYLYVMQTGSVVEEGPTESVLTSPEHPYSQQLLRSVPRKDDWLDLGVSS